MKMKKMRFRLMKVSQTLRIARLNTTKTFYVRRGKAKKVQQIGTLVVRPKIRCNTLTSINIQTYPTLACLLQTPTKSMNSFITKI